MSPTTPTKPKSSDYIPLDRQIRAMIVASGLNTNALAVASGVPQPVLHRFRMGEQKNIRMDTLDRLCEFFGVRLTAPKRRKKATQEEPKV